MYLHHDMGCKCTPCIPLHPSAGAPGLGYFIRTLIHHYPSFLITLCRTLPIFTNNSLVVHSKFLNKQIYKEFTYLTFRKKPPNNKNGIIIGGPIDKAIDSVEEAQEII